MLKKVSKQDGVNFYLDERGVCRNVDIRNDVEELHFFTSSIAWGSSSFLLKKERKQFPNIKTLVIDDLGVYEIGISNTMFPNVCEVISNNPRFKSGPMLVEQYDSTAGTSNKLLNTFFKNKDYIIDLKDVNGIGEYAFDGCLATEVINYDDVSVCYQNAFTGSMLSKSKKIYKNGAFVLGKILIDIDGSAEVAVISKETRIIADNFQIPTSLDEIIFEQAESLNLFSLDMQFPNTITINDSSKMPIAKFSQYVRYKRTKNINITDKNELYCSIDGVVYTKDKKRLIAYPENRAGYFEIPEGTEVISGYAFASSEIESVKFPESLSWIEDDAFFKCEKLKHISLNHTIEDYDKFGSSSIFYNCISIKEIDVPANVKILGKNMFYGCTPNKITFHEGIEVIKANAFSCEFPASEMILPASLKLIEESNFTGTNVNVIKAKNRTPKGILKTILISSTPYNGNYVYNNIVTLIINEGGQDYTFYIPRYLNSPQVVELDDFFSSFSPKYMEESKMDSLYKHCLTNAVSHDTALELYKLTARDCFKEALKPSRQSIVKRYFENGDEERLILFFKLGFFAKSSLEKFLKKAQEIDMISLSAYLLKEIEKKTSKKTSSKFNL